MKQLIYGKKIRKKINLTSNNIDTCDCKYNVKDIYLYFLIFLVL